MDDTTQIPHSNTAISPAPPVPVGGLNKEAGPVAEAPVAEVLQSSEKAPEISPEVVEAGVEVSKNPEVPDLTVHDKHAGLSHAPVIAPIPTQPSGIVSLDVTKEQALAEVKANRNPRNAKSWLVIEVLKAAQRKLLGGNH